jgi:glycosyltransferase involved in cell wall biosynthesis
LSKKTLIIIPAYNEEGSIGAVVESIRRHTVEADILVVNDGSQDRTARQARESGALVINLPYNMGIGSAVQSGFLFAKEKGYHFAVQVDGDGQHPSSEIPRLLEALDNGVDMAIGSRFVQPTGYRPTFTRSLGIKIFSFLVSLIVGKKVYDTTSGFRAASRKAVLLLTRLPGSGGLDHPPQKRNEIRGDSGGNAFPPGGQIFNRSQECCLLYAQGYPGGIYRHHQKEAEINHGDRHTSTNIDRVSLLFPGGYHH